MQTIRLLLGDPPNRNFFEFQRQTMSDQLHSRSHPLMKIRTGAKVCHDKIVKTTDLFTYRTNTAVREGGRNNLLILEVHIPEDI